MVTLNSLTILPSLIPLSYSAGICHSNWFLLQASISQTWLSFYHCGSVLSAHGSQLLIYLSFLRPLSVRLFAGAWKRTNVQTTVRQVYERRRTSKGSLLDLLCENFRHSYA